MGSVSTRRSVPGSREELAAAATMASSAAARTSSLGHALVACFGRGGRFVAVVECLATVRAGAAARTAGSAGWAGWGGWGDGATGAGGATGRARASRRWETG